MSRFYTNCQCIGNNIFLKEVDNGKRKKYKVEYKPTLFVNGNKKSKWHTLVGDPVEPLVFDSIREARDFVKTNNEVPDYPLYGNTQYQYAFIADTYPEHELTYDLKDIRIFTMDIEHESETSFGQDSAENASERINVITLKDFNKDVYHVFTFIDGGIYHKNNIYNPTSNVHHYECDSEEEMLLKFLSIWNKLDIDILTGWNVRFYDIPYIYNRIVQLLGEKDAKKLSPWGIVQAETVVFMNKERSCYELKGISILDYLQLYKKNIADPRENYKLDYIAKEELKGEGKVDWRDKYETMKEFYEDDFQGFVEYNIQDVKLPDLLEKKLKLIEQTVNVAYIAKVNYVDVLAQTRTWDMLIYNWLNEENIVIPQKETQEKSEQFIGAYVKDPKPGMYHNVVSFDVASLYPNIIRVLNIGPESKKMEFACKLKSGDVLSANDIWKTTFQVAKNNNCTLASNGIFYSREKMSFYSRMVETLFTNRKKYQATIRESKKELEHCTDTNRKIVLANIISSLDVKQKATKILMNSLFGAFGSQYFRYFDLHNAVAVTETGQFIIQFIQKGLNAHFNKLFNTNDIDYVIYSDTDSVYVALDNLVKHVFKGKKPTIEKLVHFMDKVCKESLEPEIDRLFGIITDKFINGMKPDKPILSMKREVIADRAIWSGKKHYILQVWNSEGDNYFECNDCHNKFSGPSEVAPPCNDCKSANTKRVAKMKIMGFDMVKSSLPKFTKDAMRKAVNIVMTGSQDELATFIESTRLAFMKLPAEDVAFPRGVNDIEKWANEADTYSKGTPIGVKAVLLHNEYLIKLGLQNKYAPIASADKIKFLHLKQPNPIFDKVIAFNGKLPVEFGLHKYIDYAEMFKATLIKPLEKILEPIGWSSEKQYDMEQFFN
jgi:DNA polymerase elongation subunit (family B)